MIKMIWAMDENKLVGKDDKIPWHVKEDLLYYKSKTKGQTVLMGDRTYFSLKGYYKDKPLPYGKIYVATIDKTLNLEDAAMVYNIDEFLSNINEDIFVVGGLTIFRLSFKYADQLYISYIKGKYEGNIYFNDLDLSNFKLISSNETEKVNYTIYERQK